MKQKLIAILVAMWVGAVWVSHAEEPWLVYAAAKVAQAPVIDGRLGDPCWQSLERTRPLTLIGGAPAPVSTTGMACWDDQNLYFALVCGEPLMAGIQQQKAEGRLSPYFESVEIFIDSAYDRFNYCQFRVDFAGNRDTHAGPDLDQALEKCWAGAAAAGQNEWTVEVAIPWSFIANGRPDAATVWGLNLNRSRSIMPEGGWTCWSDTRGPFHSPSRFANLVFFPYPVFLQNYFSAAFRSAYDEMQDMISRGRTAAAQSQTQLAAIKAENDQFLKSLENAAIASGQDAAAVYAHGQEQQRKLAALQDDLLLQALMDLVSAPGAGP